MSSRLELHELLCGIVNITEPDGDRHTYFQPPSSVRMRYPAIVYERSGINNSFANDTVYGQSNSYKVTVIDQDPESDIVKQVSLLPKCKWDRQFKSDNLNHDIFTLYY